MKVGKRKLVSILGRELQIPKDIIRIYGKYGCYGNRERLEFGSFELVAANGVISLYEPVYGDFEDDHEITYRNRIVEEVRKDA